ncbi:MAG TPA: radical SAM protein [Paenibacillus sp.]|nr:radical SAM protein [Paenibacillus sp.]
MSQPKTSKKLDEDCLNRLKKTIKHMSISRKSIINDPSYCTDLPVEIGLKLTNGCNLRCKHCFEWNDEGFHRDMDLQEQRAQLDIDIIKKILEQTQSVKSNLYLWGGEPLIYNKWNELVDLLTADPRWTVLCTNGLLIENKIESLLQISENLACLISLEGFEEENDRIRGKGTFQNVMRNIDLLLDLQRKGIYKGRVSVHMTISEYMVDKLYDFVDFFENKDIDTLYLTLPWYLPEEVSNEMDQYYNKNFKWLANNIDEHHRHSWHSFKFKLEPDFVEPLIQQMEQINQKNWSIRVRYQPGLETNQVKDYIVGSSEPVQNKEKCLALNSRMDVLTDGKVTACKHFSELAVADLNLADDIKAVWQGEEFNEVRKTINCGLMPVCSKCILLYLNGN